MISASRLFTVRTRRVLAIAIISCLKSGKFAQWARKLYFQGFNLRNVSFLPDQWMFYQVIQKFCVTEPKLSAWKIFVYTIVYKACIFTMIHPFLAWLHHFPCMKKLAFTTMPGYVSGLLNIENQAVIMFIYSKWTKCHWNHCGFGTCLKELCPIILHHHKVGGWIQGPDTSLRGCILKQLPIYHDHQWKQWKPWNMLQCMIDGSLTTKSMILTLNTCRPCSCSEIPHDHVDYDFCNVQFVGFIADKDLLIMHHNTFHGFNVFIGGQAH